MWDHSRLPAAASKWRKVTPEQLDRQARTAFALRAETVALEAGRAVPVPSRRGRDRAAAPVPAFSTARVVELRAFLGVHGREIAGVLGRARDEQQLEIAAAYQAVQEAAPGAGEAWARLVGRLDR